MSFEFCLAYPEVIMTTEQINAPVNIIHKIGIFNLKQAECVFIKLSISNVKVYAINEDKMEIRLVTNWWEAKQFFNEDESVV